MLNPLRESFRDQTRGNACQEAITAVEFFIQDPPPPSTAPCFHYLPPARNRFDLQVRNASGRLVHLIQIDRCLYSAAEGRRCDCLLLTTEQAYFVEFKAAERDITTSGNLRYARAADCVEQLEHTIKDFISRDIIPPGALVMAYACVGRTSQRPYPGADFLALSASFNNRFEGIPVRVRLIVENVLVINRSTSAD
ncbi:hypothetical protein [Hymenobacter sp. PAMC 26628]|uniref:hypothetical protein n=1 Tax=Hymenobacter sp. PAMC 26628 TaxID=1484118 RepID=UPI000AC6626F|nr:hypothetical protein [Hymenobacter sp. PAMC 26628]